MTTEITKLRNVAGKEYTCACCGRIVIEHPFAVNGLVYGKECIAKMFGDKGKKTVKIQITRAQQFASWSTSQIARATSAHKMTEESYYEYFLKTGNM
jgi:hypothetical protein